MTVEEFQDEVNKDVDLSPVEDFDYENEDDEKKDAEEIEKDESIILYPTPSQPREEIFNARTWWMLDLGGEEEDIPPYGATPLVQRCLKSYHWPVTHARRVLNSYRQFLALKKDTKDWHARLSAPCGEVEKMWKEHVVDMDNYMFDMNLLVGHVLKFSVMMDHETKERLKITTAAQLEAKFQSKFDRELWMGYDNMELDMDPQRSPAALCLPGIGRSFSSGS